MTILDLTPVTYLLERHLWLLGCFCGLSLVIAVIALLWGGRCGCWYALMTSSWVLVDIIILWWLRWHIKGQIPGSYEQHLHHVCSMLCANVLLDMGYGLVGLLLFRQRVRGHSLMWEGFAFAVWWQALGLLTLDVWSLSTLIFQ